MREHGQIKLNSASSIFEIKPSRVILAVVTIVNELVPGAYCTCGSCVVPYHLRHQGMGPHPPTMAVLPR